jgi:hypothetical protein
VDGDSIQDGFSLRTVTGSRERSGSRCCLAIGEEFTDSLEQPKPIDDADLVKAIDITSSG